MITVLPGDCREVFPFDDTFPTFDVCLTDLPYSKHTHRNATSCSARTGGRGARVRDFGFEHLSPELRRYFAGVTTRVKRWSLSYSDYDGATWLRLACEAAGAEYIRTMPWVRWLMPQLTGDRPTQGSEVVLLFHRQHVGPRGGRRHVPKAWNGPGWLTHLEHKCLRGDSKHPTGKPLDQALDLVHWFTDPGETVYDPCCGWATFGVACRLLGRNFVGCEGKSEHYDRALTALDAPADAERLERWRVLIRERIEQCRRVLENDPGSVHTQACWEAMTRDYQLAESNA